MIPTKMQVLFSTFFKFLHSAEFSTIGEKSTEHTGLDFSSLCGVITEHTGGRKAFFLRG